METMTPNAPVDAVQKRSSACIMKVVIRDAGRTEKRSRDMVNEGRNMAVRMIRERSAGWAAMENARAVNVLESHQF